MVDVLKEHLDAPNNTAVEKPRMGSLTAFFCFFGGGRLALLEKCDQGVQQARSVRGGLLFLVVLTSAMLAGLVWGDVFGWQTGLGIAVVWFLVLGFLDLCLMMSMDGSKKSASERWKTAALMIGRLGIVVVLAHFNAHFAQLKMFETEVMQVLAAEKQAKVSKTDEDLRTAQAKYRSWYDAERGRIDAALAAARKARQDLIDEISGAGGSRRPGYAQIAKTKEANITKEEGNLAKEDEAFKVAAETGPEANALRVAKEAHKATQTQIATQKSDGISNRGRALAKVAEDDAMVWWMYAFFVLLECLAFLVKLFSASDEYDLRVDRMREEAEARLQMERLDEQAKARDAVKRDLEKDAEAREAVAGFAERNAIAVLKTLKARGKEVDAQGAQAAKIKAASDKMKDAGMARVAREQFETDAHGKVVDIRAFRA